MLYGIWTPVRWLTHFTIREHCDAAPENASHLPTVVRDGMTCLTR